MGLAEDEDKKIDEQKKFLWLKKISYLKWSTDVVKDKRRNDRRFSCAQISAIL